MYIRLAEGIENIGKKDVVWSYLATFFTVGAGVILLPFMSYKFSSEIMGIWVIFQTINQLVILLDMGFRPSFARNISYVFSGVKHLQTVGIEDTGDYDVDYSLLNGTLKAMRRFYSWMALATLILLGIVGTIYILYVLEKFNGDRTDIIIAWVLQICINCYNLYTLYYDALLTGKGYIKRAQQINIIGQSLYLLLAIGLVYAGLGLTAIVASQLLSIILRRILSYRVFFTHEMKAKLAIAGSKSANEILKAISPNSIKSGLTSLGGFLVNKSAVFISSAFLPLAVTASYGITLQVIDILCRCSTVMYVALLPKLAQYRVERNTDRLKKDYEYCVISLLVIFLIGGAVFVTLGNPVLELINSQTYFLPVPMLCLLLFFYCLEENHIVAAGFIMADNKIPFFIPSLLSGAATIILLYLFVGVLNWGVWGMILAPGLAQLSYQNWKWPSVVIKEFYKQ